MLQSLRVPTMLLQLYAFLDDNAYNTLGLAIRWMP
jgi:hypothetical protein